MGVPSFCFEQESCLILTPSCLSSLMIRHAARGSPTGQRDYLPFLCLVSLSGCSAVSFGQPLISLHLAKRLCLLLRCFHRSIFVSFALLFSLGYLSFACQLSLVPLSFYCTMMQPMIHSLRLGHSMSTASNSLRLGHPTLSTVVKIRCTTCCMGLAQACPKLFTGVHQFGDTD